MQKKNKTQKTPQCKHIILLKNIKHHHYYYNNIYWLKVWIRLNVLTIKQLPWFLMISVCQVYFTEHFFLNDLKVMLHTLYPRACMFVDYMNLCLYNCSLLLNCSKCIANIFECVTCWHIQNTLSWPTYYLFLYIYRFTRIWIKINWISLYVIIK